MLSFEIMVILDWTSPLRWIEGCTVGVRRRRHSWSVNCMAVSTTFFFLLFLSGGGGGGPNHNWSGVHPIKGNSQCLFVGYNCFLWGFDFIISDFFFFFSITKTMTEKKTIGQNLYFCSTAWQPVQSQGIIYKQCSHRMHQGTGGQFKVLSLRKHWWTHQPLWPGRKCRAWVPDAAWR